MIKKLLWIILALVSIAQAAPFDPEATPALKPLPQQSQAAHLAAELLIRYHYKATPLDDAMSKKIFDHYLKSLDPERLVFVKSDIDQLTAARTRLDDAIIGEDLSIPFAIYNLYARRVGERFAYARRLLKDGFDFSAKESYQYEREKEDWAKSEDEVRELWRKRVKNDWLRLKLAGKDDKGIAETLDKRYENSQKRIVRAKSDDAFALFMNSYTMAIDPHTNYMGLRAAEDFDIAMRLSLVGIGASLSEKDDYTTIRELIAGGPAILSGELRSATELSASRRVTRRWSIFRAGASTTRWRSSAAPPTRWSASTSCRWMPAPTASTSSFRWSGKKSRWRPRRPGSRCSRCVPARPAVASG